MTLSAHSSPRTAVVRTGARLHFGFLSCKPATGRQFGGAGVMVDSPGFEIVVRKSREYGYHGPPVWEDRVQALVARLPNAAPFEIDIRSEIPPHIGLGSGTQLAMAIASAVFESRGEGAGDAATLACRIGRGARSAIGVHGFLRGGFLFDAGKSAEERIGSLAHRFPFPDQWRFVLITPPTAVGLAGPNEQEAFQRLPAMPAATTQHLRAMVESELVPAVREADVRKCGEALYEFGRIVGEYFAPVQGGTYAHRRMANLVGHLRNQGVSGVGQTSWGPTLFALCGSRNEAEQVVRDLQTDSRWSDCEFRVTAARNFPADVRILAE